MCANLSLTINVCLVVSNTLWMENPVTGGFVPVHTEGPANAKNIGAAGGGGGSSGGKNHPEQMPIEDEEQLENTPLIPKLDKHELGTGKEKVLSVPPVPKLRNIDDVHQNTDEWTNVRMEYRNFAFVKRSAFLIFQGLLGGFCVITIFSAQAAVSSMSHLVHMIFNLSPLSL